MLKSNADNMTFVEKPDPISTILVGFCDLIIENKINESILDKPGLIDGLYSLRYFSN